MDTLFSQVPTIVLNKHRPKNNKLRQQKKVSITEPSLEEKKFGSFKEEDDYDFKKDQDCDFKEDRDFDEEPQAIPIIGTSDAVIQTDPPRLVDRSTQTDISLFDYDKYCSVLEERSLTSVFKPMQLNSPGGDPPLKIGLSLRGKKRKVFYPDADG